MQLRTSSLVCFLSLFLWTTANGQYDSYDYHYGDDSYTYDYNEFESAGSNHLARKGEVPLCCPKGSVYNHVACETSDQWKPTIYADPDINLEYVGLPKCKGGATPIEINQDGTFFDVDYNLNLPFHIQLHPATQKQFCFTRISSTDVGTRSPGELTKVFVCVEKDLGSTEWTAVAFAHLFLILTLVAFFLIQELRSMQGQYLICWLISLLVYNLFLYPVSSISLDISFANCIGLDAIKYFFFCGIVLWFNVICFDIWRTMKWKQDISGRRRFILYSVYSWVIGAILTTVVLIRPFLDDGTTSSSNGQESVQIMANFDDKCFLKLEVNIILELFLLGTMMINLVFLILASTHICTYPKFGNGLPRSEALLTLKQCWKLFVIMTAFSFMGIPPKFISDSEIIAMWLFILLESAAIFAVFAYRKSVIRHLGYMFCSNTCFHYDQDMSDHEKGQLTPMH